VRRHGGAAVTHLDDWVGAAEALCREAGELLLEKAEGLAAIRTEFKGRRELVTAADRAAEEMVVRGLLKHFPEHGVLAEEGVLTPRGKVDKDARFVAILDPIDGTTNFVHGLPNYCVALALRDGDRMVAGVCHAPALGVTYRACVGGGAFANDRPIQVTATAAVRDALVATGFSYDRNEPDHDDNLGKLAAVLPECRDLRRLGSAELDLCHVAAGHYDGYWELYLQPYDVAAGAVIVQEAGGRVTDLRGGEDWLFGRQVLATNGAIHGEMLGLLGRG